MSRRTAKELFWLYVQKSANCWEWTGHVDGGGYGRFHMWVGNVRKHCLAHRVSWEFRNGPVPDGMNVCHKCDNRKCVCPDHLFLGTTYDNNRDMIDKGRFGSDKWRGENNGNRKLTDTDVVLMRMHYAEGETTCEELAKAYGVTRSTTHAILSFRTWKHVPCNDEIKSVCLERLWANRLNCFPSSKDIGRAPRRPRPSKTTIALTCEAASYQGCPVR